MEQHRAFSVTVVAPTHNNARTLRAVVTQLTQLNVPVICVNDGSTDETAQILAELSRSAGVTVVTHEQNRGKATALLTGFVAAEAAGHTHALTIDTDGQLDPQEIPQLLRAARENPNALIIGTRDDSAPDYPARSRTGRRVSNLLVRLESGVRVSDSQCGFRVYPLGLVRATRCGARYYGFETEIITRAGWAGCALREVPVSCRYLPAGERVSHFRPWLDSFRAVAMHVRLLARAMFPWPHPKWPTDRAAAASDRPRWRRLIDWISPARVWRELREQRLASHEVATGVAVGVFIGNLPVFGVQTLLSLYAARRLHLHPLPVVIGSHISTPPVGPVLVAVAIGVGHWLLHGKWLELPAWQATWSEWARVAGRLMIEWSVGALLVGFVLAVTSWIVSNFLLRYLAAAAPAPRD
jgi:uncharacterized protein (DUF2062 family)